MTTTCSAHVSTVTLMLWILTSYKCFFLLFFYSFIRYIFLPSISPFLSFWHPSPLQVSVIYGWVCVAIEDKPLQVSPLPPLLPLQAPSLRVCSQSSHAIGLLGWLVPSHTFSFSSISPFSFFLLVSLSYPLCREQFASQLGHPLSSLQ